MRRLTLAVFICLLPSLPILAQKGKPTPPPPPVTVTLPEKTDLNPDLDLKFTGLGGSFKNPLFFGDGNGTYVGGQQGITTTLTLATTKGGVVVATYVDLRVSQADGRRVGVQGLSYVPTAGPYESVPQPDQEDCRFSLWDTAGTGLTGALSEQYPGCTLDFLGGVILGPHMHPPDPYERFGINVRIPTDLTSIQVDTEWTGASTHGGALWFGDATHVGECAAQDWSDAAGGWDDGQQFYWVQRNSETSWTIAVWKAYHRINEFYNVVTPGRRGKGNCSLTQPYFEFSGPVRYWFTVSY